MEKTLQSVTDALTDLSSSILEAYKDDRTLTEVFGWNCPALNRYDLAELPKGIAEKLNSNPIENIPEELQIKIQKIPERISIFKAHSLPHLFNSNSVHAASVYMSLIEWISSNIEPLFGWEVLQDNKALPNNLSRRLRSIQAELNEIIPNTDNLRSQIKLINDATEAAESLPTDLESLKEARGKVSKISTDAAELYGKMGSHYEQAEAINSQMGDKQREAEKIVEKCEEAYKIATTTGLAAAFDYRAKKLNQTMWIWVVGLLLSLVAGAIIGSSRFNALVAAIQSKDPQWGVIWMDFSLSIIGLAAPIWFAWLATKQISQRFKLAEDYAFKASVAKAYEGYRKEAARIDEELEARLFSSALTRLDEAPLRLVDGETHGSPWHEFFSSQSFQKTLSIVPDLKEKIISLISDNLISVKKKETVKASDATNGMSGDK